MSNLRFSATHNTSSDWVKGLFSAIAAGLPLLFTANTDDSITSQEWIGIVSGIILAFGAALGFYSQNDSNSDNE